MDGPRPVAEAGHDGRVTDIGEPDLRSSDAAAVDSRVEPDAAPPVPDAAEADLGSVDPNLPEGEDFGAEGGFCRLSGPFQPGDLPAEASIASARFEVVDGPHCDGRGDRAAVEAATSGLSTTPLCR